MLRIRGGEELLCEFTDDWEKKDFLFKHIYHVAPSVLDNPHECEKVAEFERESAREALQDTFIVLRRDDNGPIKIGGISGLKTGLGISISDGKKVVIINLGLETDAKYLLEVIESEFAVSADLKFRIFGSLIDFDDNEGIKKIKDVFLSLHTAVTEGKCHAIDVLSIDIQSTNLFRYYCRDKQNDKGINFAMKWNGEVLQVLLLATSPEARNRHLQDYLPYGENVEFTSCPVFSDPLFRPFSVCGVVRKLLDLEPLTKEYDTIPGWDDVYTESLFKKSILATPNIILDWMAALEYVSFRNDALSTSQLKVFISTLIKKEIELHGRQFCFQQLLLYAACQYADRSPSYQKRLKESGLLSKNPWPVELLKSGLPQNFCMDKCYFWIAAIVAQKHYNELVFSMPPLEDSTEGEETIEMSEGSSQVEIYEFSTDIVNFGNIDNEALAQVFSHVQRILGKLRKILDLRFLLRELTIYENGEGSSETIPNHNLIRQLLESEVNAPHIEVVESWYKAKIEFLILEIVNKILHSRHIKEGENFDFVKNILSSIFKDALFSKIRFGNVNFINLVETAENLDFTSQINDIKYSIEYGKSLLSYIFYFRKHFRNRKSVWVDWDEVRDLIKEWYSDFINGHFKRDIEQEINDLNIAVIDFEVQNIYLEEEQEIAGNEKGECEGKEMSSFEEDMDLKGKGKEKVKNKDEDETVDNDGEEEQDDKDDRAAKSLSLQSRFH